MFSKTIIKVINLSYVKVDVWVNKDAKDHILMRFKEAGKIKVNGNGMN